MHCGSIPGLYPLVAVMITQHFSDIARYDCCRLVLIGLGICTYVVKVYQKIIINAKFKGVDIFTLKEVECSNFLGKFYVLNWVVVHRCVLYFYAFCILKFHS